MKNYTRSSQLKIRAILLITLVILIPVLLTWVNYQFAVENPGGNDFLARWNGAHEWLKNGSNPYSNQVSEIAQQYIYGRQADSSKGEDIAHFVYPFFSMLFFAPFGLMEYTLARAVFMTLLEVSMVVVCLLALKLTNWRLKSISLAGMILITLLGYYSVRTIILGQFSGVNAVIILLALFAIKKNQDIFAGIMLALTLSKPQMSYLLIIFVLLWSLSVHRNRVLLGFVSAFLVMMAVTLILIPSWPLDWLRQVVNYPEYTNRVGSIPSIIAGWTPGIARPVEYFLNGIFFLYLIIEWFRCRGREYPAFLWTAYLTLVITNLVTFRTATPHYVLLIPALFLISKILLDKWGKPGRWAVWGLISLNFIGIWALFLATVKNTDESAWVYLPMPFLMLFLLMWFRWWAIKAPILVGNDS